MLVKVAPFWRGSRHAKSTISGKRTFALRQLTLQLDFDGFSPEPNGTPVSLKSIDAVRFNRQRIDVTKVPIPRPRAR
jgi:hypothetical protein